MFSNQDKPALFLFRDENDSESYDRKSVEAIFEKVAHTYHKRIQFVISGITTSFQGLFAKQFGVTKEMLPTFRIKDKKHKIKYDFEQWNPNASVKTLKEEDLREFLEAFRENKLMPSLKSEEVPDIQKTNVLNIVGKTYK